MRSMTGYGRAGQVLEGRDITVEIRSVNHRFFELSARVPRTLGYLEEKIKRALNGKIARGKVDVNVAVLSLAADAAQVEINHDLARAYVNSMRKLGDDLGLHDDLSLSSLTRFSDIFIVRKTVEDADEVWKGVQIVLQEALDTFIAMRQREGERLFSDLQERLSLIEQHLTDVEIQSPKTTEEYRARLFAKLAEVLSDRQLEESRVLTEAAIFAEKTAVAEETVRLRSHITEFRNILTADGAAGRKLDFLVQEMNREVNTIGSKAQDISIARHIVEMKSEIEKIREQIQNIE